jgi:hypothetical protein
MRRSFSLACRSVTCQLLIRRPRCSHNATVTFQLKRNIFLAPDVIDVAQTKVGVTMSFRLAEPCTAHHENDYYGHIESSGSTSGDGAHIGNCAGY